LDLSRHRPSKKGFRIKGSFPPKINAAPLEPVRASLAQQGLPDARTVASMKNGDIVRYAALVICRQRPGTAGGVVFMTLEDETGFVNAVVWESVFQRYSVLGDHELFRNHRNSPG
jgi:DNA polymerase III alpha subunit